jgi:hypothetical protein
MMRCSAGNRSWSPGPSPLCLCPGRNRPPGRHQAKGRPAGQSIGVGLDNSGGASEHLALAPSTLVLAHWLLECERVSLMVAVAAYHPACMAPAISEGPVFFASSWIAPVRVLLGQRRFLYRQRQPNPKPRRGRRRRSCRRVRGQADGARQEMRYRTPADLTGRRPSFSSIKTA